MIARVQFKDWADIPAGDFPSCMALQNTWCILFSDPNLPDFGDSECLTKLVAEQSILCLLT